MEVAPNIQPGDDSRKNWKAINFNGSVLRELVGDHLALKDQVATGRRPPRVEGRHPFQVYFKAPHRRPFADFNGAEDWRTFKVRHGYVNCIKTDGCDDADQEGTVPEVIVVPEATESYKVWVEVTLDSSQQVQSAVVAHGEDYWAGHPTALSTDGLTYHRLIARIDTQTLAERKKAVVKQFLRDNFWVDGLGGGDGRWS
jgi:hypothetical protein